MGIPGLRKGTMGGQDRCRACTWKANGSSPLHRVYPTRQNGRPGGCVAIC